MTKEFLEFWKSLCETGRFDLWFYLEIELFLDDLKYCINKINVFK